MNPNSKEAVAERATLHREALARLQRLRSDGAASAYELECAESDVTAGLARMEAMGDPLPTDAAASVYLPVSVAPSLTPPSPGFTPQAAADSTSLEPAPDPVEVLVARILKA